jgi:outer membrane protein assembly factor BamA
MITKKILAIALVLTCGLSRVSAGTTGVQNQKKEAPPEKSTVVILPIVFYTPETKLAGGIGGLMAFHPPGSPAGGRPAALSFYAIYTQLKQFSAKMEPEIYLQDEKSLIKGKLDIEQYPNKFWGFGENAPSSGEEGYTPRIFSVEVSFQRKILPKASLYAGIQIAFERLKVLRADCGGRISAGAVAGASGGTVAGLGFVLTRDNRDNIFYPHRGDYWQVTTVFNGKVLGGEFAYTSLKIDLRKYIPISSSQVLAVQGLLKAVGGTPPFYNYAKLGGDNTMRGYYSGRYRDKIMAAVQAEYRVTLSERFGAVGFVGLGDVAPRLGSFDFARLKSSIGAGLRYRVSRGEATNLRMDIAYGKGSSGFYLTANEAF